MNVTEYLTVDEPYRNKYEVPETCSPSAFTFEKDWQLLYYTLMIYTWKLRDRWDSRGKRAELIKNPLTRFYSRSK